MNLDALLISTSSIQDSTSGLDEEHRTGEEMPVAKHFENAWRLAFGAALVED
jgi:hypothetical protein